MAHGWPSSGVVAGPGAIVHRGIVLGAKDLARIQAIVDERPWLKRAAIARRVCTRFGWRTPGGTYAVEAARLLLTRCEQRGLLRLPSLQRRPRSARRSPGLPDAPLGPPPGCEPRVNASAPLVVRPITPEERLGWRLHMQRFHYLGDCAHVGESLRYAGFVEQELVALVSWAAAALHSAPRDTYLGWDGPRKLRRLPYVVNNARFLMLPWIRTPHLASRVLAANLRRLSADWQARYGHPVLLAETFVDVSRFRGTCYRASNWIELGQTQGFSRDGTSYRPNGQPKAVFVYPLHRRARAWLGGEHSPLDGPSQKERILLDVAALPVRGHGSLVELFEGMVDYRKARGKRFSLPFLLSATSCAVLSGSKSVRAIVDWMHEQSRDTLKRLGSRAGIAPSDRTIRRLFDGVDIGEFDRRLGRWMARRTNLKGVGLAIDGKTARGSGHGGQNALHLVSAVVHGKGLVVAQEPVPDKSNEIKSVEPVLRPLDIRGAVVTGDAMFTQKDIASYLVEKKGADYLLTVKENQPTLLADIVDLRMEVSPPGAPDDGEGSRSN